MTPRAGNAKGAARTDAAKPGAGLLGLAAASTLALLGGSMGGCARECEITPTGERCEYESICLDDPPECHPKFAPGRMLLAFSTPLPLLVEVYRGENLETAEKLHADAPVSDKMQVTLSEGEYVVTALYVRGGDSTLVVATEEMVQNELFLCSEKECYEYERAEADLRLR